MTYRYFSVDDGASQLISSGRIKVKNGTNISKISQNGIHSEDGSEMSADVIIFATGFVDHSPFNSFTLIRFTLVLEIQEKLCARYVEMR